MSQARLFLCPLPGPSSVPTPRSLVLFNGRDWSENPLTPGQGEKGWGRAGA